MKGCRDSAAFQLFLSGFDRKNGWKEKKSQFYLVIKIIMCNFARKYG